MQRFPTLYGVALLAAACGARSPLDVPSATIVPPATTTPANVADAAAPVAPLGRTLSAAWSQSCATTRNGNVACWGESVADGIAASGNVPVLVPGLDDIVEIAAGSLLNCARKSDGSVACWGRSTNGAVVPLRGARFESIVAGPDAACGITGGRVACVGARFVENGACKDALPVWDATPTIVPGLIGMTGVALGSFHACAFDGAGATSCWGCSGGDEPRLVYSLGSNTPSTNTPVPVTAATSTTRIAASTASTCAVQTDGTTLCWGDRSQFGRGITIDPTPPTAADFPPHPIDLGIGPTFACAAYADEVKCLGGMPTFEDGCKDRRDDPQSFPLPGVREISVGLEHVCARDAQGTVWCWGCNSQGEVGDGTRTPRATPVRVALN